MKFTKLFFVFLFLSTLFSGCGDDENDYKIGGVTKAPTGNAESGNSNNGGNSNSGSNNTTADIETAKKRLEFPMTRTTDGSFVIVHNALLNTKTGERGVNYCVEWDPSLHAQRWCCYQIYGKTENGVMHGTRGSYVDRYTADPKGSLTADAQYPNDPDIDKKYQFTVDPFWGSGYDHGHICPSADRLGSFEANYQTFYMTNMMPQVNGFNAKIWATMEGMVRDWAPKFDTLYVCKGGTIDKAKHIVEYRGSGDNKIPVPRYFFMALLGRNGNTYTALAFWIRSNSNGSSDVSPYIVNIDTLESYTDIDFFCNLPDDMEAWVESLPIETIKAIWGVK